LDPSNTQSSSSLSLAARLLTRENAGLDYYTGVIYEVVTEGSAPEIPASEEAKEQVAKKKKSGKPGDPEEDRSDDPTLGIGM
jgi:hypothetical protein